MSGGPVGARRFGSSGLRQRVFECGMLPPRTQGYFLLLVQEKVAKENDTPDGANTPAHPRFRDPALILRGILPRRSGADILSAPPSGRPPRPPRWAGAAPRGAPNPPR